VTLTATITDSSGQMTLRTVVVKVESPTPTPTATPEAFGATPTPAATPPQVVVAAANTLAPPSRLTLYHAGVLLRRASATLGADCRYRVTLRLTRVAAGHKVVVKARFLTQAGLLARSAPPRTVTVRR
jgi:hypothetical protein